MAGELKLDEGGLSGLIRELQVHAATSDDHASEVDAALTAAAGAAVSSPLTGALQRLADRFHGSTDDVGERMTSLSASLMTAAHAITTTDSSLADSAHGIER